MAVVVMEIGMQLWEQQEIVHRQDLVVLEARLVTVFMVTVTLHGLPQVCATEQ